MFTKMPEVRSDQSQIRSVKGYIFTDLSCDIIFNITPPKIVPTSRKISHIYSLMVENYVSNRSPVPNFFCSNIIIRIKKKNR